MNSRLRTIIVDDESHCVKTLAWQLNEFCAQVEVVAKCTDPEDAIVQIRALKPDLVMLDIEMPNMNAFDMLKHLERVDFDIIFTTAYDQFAVSAFRVSALDYLLKPIVEEELVAAIDKAIARHGGANPQQLELLHERLAEPKKPPERMAVPTRDGLEFISVKGIIYCESESNYTHIVMDDGKPHFINRTLKEIQEALEGANFFRIHNSYLVSLDHVRKYVRGDGGYLVMSNGKSLTVSRAKKDELMAVIGRV